MRTLIKGSQRKISLWAGGSSSQICIYPPEAEYAQRNFLYRISTAVADTDEWSDYTMLPGVCRHLLMLDGEAEVQHESRTVFMQPYEPVNVFDGGEKTKAKGKVRDFNLMTKDGCEGTMTVGVPALAEGVSHRLLFCGEGEADVIFTDEIIHLEKEDALLLIPAENCKVNCSENGRIVCCDMKL